MKAIFFNLFILVLIGNTFAQQFTIFENNEKNKSLFDYSDPHSLVSILLQNKHVFEKISDVCSILNFIPSDGMFQTRISGPPIEFESSKSDGIFLTKQNENECFEDWYNNLLSRPDSLYYDGLKIIDKERLKSIYNNTKEQHSLRWEPQLSYFDLRNIDCIIMDSSKIYLARKSALENKKQIVFSCAIESILNLNFSNYSSGYISDDAIQLSHYIESNVSKNLSKKLSEFQLKRMAQDTLDINNSYNLNQNSYYTFLKNEGLVEYDDFESDDSKAFNLFKRKNLLISKVKDGGDWVIENFISSDDSLDYWETRTLYRDSEQETFEAWYNRLIFEGDSFDKRPKAYELLAQEPFELLKKQYEKTKAGNVIKRPSREIIYWIDYPDPAVYIQCGIKKNTVDNSFQIKPNTIIYTEKINNIIGYNDKPLQLMSYTVGENADNPKINEILKDELQLFTKKINFEWIKLIQNKTGKKVSLAELKKLIIAYEISSDGITF